MNLEDLPQLVIDKIISLLDHKQLLNFEQVSRTLKCAVDAHFATTDHLVIGHLPEIECPHEPTAKDQKCLEGLLKIIKRCGVRLRTIQFVTTYQRRFTDTTLMNHHRYCNHFFASVQVSKYCPNIENIIESPKMDGSTMLESDMFCQQHSLDINDAEIYANNIELFRGEACKLRSVQLTFRPEIEELQLLNHFPNLEQISVFEPDENFYDILPQLIENGLKDLRILIEVNLRIAEKYFNIWKDLRSLRFGAFVHRLNDIEALNKLQLPKNVDLAITIMYVGDCFVQLNESVSNSIVECKIYGPIDYSRISKLKNLQQFDIMDSEQLQFITEESFPKLRKILCGNSLCHSRNCVPTNRCHSETFLPQLLINKGNQLTHIEIPTVCNKSMRGVWKALKHCKAAICIQFLLFYMHSPLTVTYEDVEVISDLPNLQIFRFQILQTHDDMRLLGAKVQALLERAAKENEYYQFECKLSEVALLTLYRINL